MDIILFNSLLSVHNYELYLRNQKSYRINTSNILTSVWHFKSQGAKTAQCLFWKFVQNIHHFLHVFTAGFQ